MSNKQLTNKQEAFVQSYLRTSNAYQAYLEAYDVKPDTPRSTTEANASRTLNNSKVVARLMELRDQVYDDNVHEAREQAKEHAVAAEVTIDSVSVMLQRAYAKAEDMENGSAAMTTAALGLAKLHGLIINKSEDVTPRRSAAEINARLNQLLRPYMEKEFQKRLAEDRERTLPTVSDVGTA